MADIVDQATDLAEAERADVLARAAHGRALRAHAAGSPDGLCDTCGEPIAAARLAALPAARSCIDCARAAERAAA